MGIVLASGFAALPVSAFDFEAGGLCYGILNGDNNQVEVTYRQRGSGNSAYVSGDITVPATVEHDSKTYDVIAIGDNAFEACSNLGKIVLPESVTTIGNKAFNGCKSLTEATLPANLTVINNFAFMGCSSLGEIALPDKVEKLGESAFEGCSSLTSVVLPNSVKTLGACAFQQCKKLNSVNLGNSLETIGWYAFSGCELVKSIDIPASVIFMEAASCFFNCEGMTAINVSPDNKNYASKDGLLYDKKLETLLTCPKGVVKAELPETVVAIGDSAFRYNFVLESVTMHEGIKTIGDEAFLSCWTLSSLDIPNSVTTIGIRAFERCEAMTSITLPSSLTAISERMLLRCSRLQAIEIPEQVTSIGAYAFMECKGLKELKMPDAVKTISESAFLSCWHLAKIELGKSVESIDGSAFTDCDELAEVTCQSAKPAVIQENTFEASQYSTVTLNVPEGSKDAYAAAQYWKEFTNVNEFPVESGIGSVDADAAKVELGRYDITGKAVDRDYNGIVVIVYSDGSRAKVLAK